MLRAIPLFIAATATAAFAVVAVAAPSVNPSQPQDPSGPSDSARYTFYRANDTFLRLDVMTGHVSECGWTSTGWSCKVLPDERRVLEYEIDRLQEGNSALKKALLDRGLSLPEGIKPDPRAEKSPGVRVGLPGRTEFNQLTAFVGTVWQSMVEMMAKLQRNIL